MRGGEVWMLTFDVPAGFADDLQIADHGVLHQVVLREANFVNVVGVAMNTFNRLKNMAELVGQTLDVVAHTGSASESTAARNLSGNPFGVNTSTVTPRSWRNS
jgi:hypothetical protein